MNAPHVSVSNVVAGEGVTRFACDVRVTIAEGAVLVIRDARLIETARGGRFVGWPRRLHGEHFIDLVGFEGEGAGEFVGAIRAAMKRQLETPGEREQEVRHEDIPF
ncbi:MAG: hypothetical protein ACSLFQ_10140 [Thermoanaerobaculia bacterium]